MNVSMITFSMMLPVVLVSFSKLKLTYRYFHYLFLQGCYCSLTGTEGDESCSDGNGACNCAEGYSGQYCENCISGYYQVNDLSYEECLPCDCNLTGTFGGSANCINGFCSCDFGNGFTGTKCDECLPGLYLTGSTCQSNCSSIESNIQ